jgi:hypothetical protein
MKQGSNRNILKQNGSVCLFYWQNLICSMVFRYSVKVEKHQIDYFEGKILKGSFTGADIIFPDKMFLYVNW